MSLTAFEPSASPDENLSLGGLDGAETVDVRPLIPTPERLHQLLEMDLETVERLYTTSSERSELVDIIMSQQESLSEYHNNIFRDEMSELIRVGGDRLANNPEVSLSELENTLLEVQRTLAAKRDFLIETSPEELPEGAEDKAALLERVKESEVATEDKHEKGLWRKAWDTITWLPRKHPVVTALLALAGAAWGIYALWDYLGEIIIVPNPIEGAGEVAETVVAPTGGEVTGVAQGNAALPNSTLPAEGLEGYNPNSPQQPGVFANPNAPAEPAAPPIELPPDASGEGSVPIPESGKDPTEFFRRRPL